MNKNKYIKIYNFDEIEKSGKNYGGASGFKLGVKFNEEKWLLKFPRSTKNMTNVSISYTTTPLSEYIGSHIYEAIGIPAHETMLGIKDGKVVVACKDFIKKGETLEEFRETKNEYIKELENKIDSLSVSGIPTDIAMEVIDIVMNNNTFFIENPNLKEHFWNMFVIDTLIGNNDRNNGNWGIIKDSNADTFLQIAPVYDNGAAFYNKKSKEEMANLLNNSNKFQNTVINSMRCPFSENGKEINPKKYIESLKNEDLNQAVLRIVPNIDLNKIKGIIDEIPNIDERTKIEITSDVQKEFYYKVLEARYEEILLPAYEKLYDKVIDKNYELYKDKIEAIYSEEFGKDFKNKTNFESLVKSNMKEDILSLNKGYLIYKDEEDNEYLVTNIKDKDIKVIKTKDISELLEQNKNNGEEEE